MLKREGARHTLARGIILADTKFEFGLVGDTLTLMDETLTPDSSRFWPATGYAVGTSPPSLDKQIMRDHLERSGWSKTPPPPDLPADIVEAASRRYQEILDILTRS